ncbi:hypothetical protein vseg_003643 [Gypsophila vaccaria]
MLQDAKRLSSQSRNWQFHGSDIHQPARDLNSILSLVPFAQWGIDILGSFTAASGGRKYMMVVVDCFSNWVEAKAVVKITELAVRKIIWHNVITKFGVPKVMVFDLGRQFENNPLREWLERFDIVVAYSAVCHPQSNG